MKVEEEDCFTRLQIFEQSGVRKVLECGSTSGTASCGLRCVNIGSRIGILEGEIRAIDGKIAAIDERAVGDFSIIAANLSDDHLARVVALEQLAERGTHVRVVEFFLIGFFVFVDILPFSMKLATSMGEYEYVRDTLLMQSMARDRLRRPHHPGVEKPLRHPRRHRIDHPPGRDQDRSPTQPLHRPAQDPPVPRHHRRSDQHPPARSVVDNHPATGEDHEDKPPLMPRPRRLNKATESYRPHPVLQGIELQNVQCDQR